MKTVRDILEIFGNYCWEKCAGGHKIDDKYIDQALKKIDAIYKSKVPKKKDEGDSVDVLTYVRRINEYSFNQGYNQAIDDFHKEG